MGYIEKQRGRYRARYRDAHGRVTSTTFNGCTCRLRQLAAPRSFGWLGGGVVVLTSLPGTTLKLDQFLGGRTEG
jgi:hypothetical protein